MAGVSNFFSNNNNIPSVLKPLVFNFSGSEATSTVVNFSVWSTVNLRLILHISRQFGSLSNLPTILFMMSRVWR